MNKGVLFVCSHNSARSQMAEGWLRHLAGDRFDVHSAGVEPGELNPLAVRAMAEAGVDISRHAAEGIERYAERVPIDHVIVVCDAAAQRCPRFWPGIGERQLWPFDDPSAAPGSEEEKLAVFRRVRDEIRARIEQWLTEMSTPGAQV
jgi:arsenate reductase